MFSPTSTQPLEGANEGDWGREGGRVGTFPPEAAVATHEQKPPALATPKCCATRHLADGIRGAPLPPVSAREKTFYPQTPPSHPPTPPARCRRAHLPAERSRTFCSFVNRNVRNLLIEFQSEESSFLTTKHTRAVFCGSVSGVVHPITSGSWMGSALQSGGRAGKERSIPQFVIVSGLTLSARVCLCVCVTLSLSVQCVSHSHIYLKKNLKS